MAFTISLYLVTGLIYIFSKSNNHEIKVDELGRDIRVRREIRGIDVASKVHDIFTSNARSDENVRQKRQLQFYLSKINNETLLTHNTTRINNHHHKWRGNHTWRITGNASRRHHRGNKSSRHSNRRHKKIQHHHNKTTHKRYHKHNRTAVFNSTYTGFSRQNKFKNIQSNFTYTHMPRFNKTVYRLNIHRHRHGHNISRGYTAKANNSGNDIKYGDPKFNNSKLNHGPGSLPIPEFNGTNAYEKNKPYRYNNINSKIAPVPSTTVAPTTDEEIVISACVVNCYTQCPKNMHRVGNQCVGDIIGDY